MEHSAPDVVVIGAGIVGLAVARELCLRRPKLRCVVVEKEGAVAQHQTGHNSGVIHTGVYYRPESTRARMCTRGRALLERFCTEHGVPRERCGKVIVATNEAEHAAVEGLIERATKNGVRAQLVGQSQLREIEPHAAGVAALHVPDAGVVDYRAVARELLRQFEAQGGEVLLNAAVKTIEERDGEVVVITAAGELRPQLVINCAGLYSDRIARMTGFDPGLRIVPFRGEYYELRPEAAHLCRGLIYPAPDPRLPFLGVHFTRGINGVVDCGPNAVLAMSREGYTRGDIKTRDVIDAMSWWGLHRLMWRHWRSGLRELRRSRSPRLFGDSLRRLVPELRDEDLIVSAAGVRAQAVDRKGELVDDFVICGDRRFVHVCNAPSPAATSSLAIAEVVCAEALKRFAA